jgi:hypothetical protein
LRIGTTPPQHGHNTPSHGGGVHTLWASLSCEGILCTYCVGVVKVAFFYANCMSPWVEGISIFFFLKKKIILSLAKWIFVADECDTDWEFPCKEHGKPLLRDFPNLVLDIVAMSLCEWLVGCRSLIGGRQWGSMVYK